MTSIRQFSAKTVVNPESYGVEVYFFVGGITICSMIEPIAESFLNKEDGKINLDAQKYLLIRKITDIFPLSREEIDAYLDAIDIYLYGNINE